MAIFEVISSYGHANTILDKAAVYQLVLDEAWLDIAALTGQWASALVVAAAGVVLFAALWMIRYRDRRSETPPCATAKFQMMPNWSLTSWTVDHIRMRYGDGDGARPG